MKYKAKKMPKKQVGGGLRRMQTMKSATKRKK
jgi:hypothetical protein